MSFNVYVVGGNVSINAMFMKEEGMYIPVSSIEEADIVCFQGGADINPSLYGEGKHLRTSCVASADARDVQAWEEAKDKVKIGICRGGQFLNVMSGGKLYQDVNNHGHTHDIVDFLISQRTVPVTSTHHQMMIPAEDGLVIAAARNQATWFCTKEFQTGVPDTMKPKWETEVVWYERTHSLCFQPHPEYGHRETTRYFFDLLDHIL